MSAKLINFAKSLTKDVKSPSRRLTKRGAPSILNQFDIKSFECRMLIKIQNATAVASEPNIEKR